MYSFSFPTSLTEFPRRLPHWTRIGFVFTDGISGSPTLKDFPWHLWTWPSSLITWSSKGKSRSLLLLARLLITTSLIKWGSPNLKRSHSDFCSENYDNLTFQPGNFNTVIVALFGLETVGTIHMTYYECWCAVEGLYFGGIFCFCGNPLPLDFYLYESTCSHPMFRYHQHHQPNSKGVW